MSDWYFIRPTDSLFLRGNQAFGDGGEHGAGVMLPVPSVLAGALRSAMLAQDPAELAAYTHHGRAINPRLAASLGTPAQPGSFRLGWLSLARCTAADKPHATVEALLPLPADLVCFKEGFARLRPQAMRDALPGIHSSAVLPLQALLHSASAAKPQGACYLSQAGWALHLTGRHDPPHSPQPEHAVPPSALAQADPRLGIGLDPHTGTAQPGLIYTTVGQAFHPAPADGQAFGFLVGVQGAAGLLPASGHLRLGGDGRSATYQRVQFTPPQVDLGHVQQHRRFRLLLRTPGLFGGWLPPGVHRVRTPDGQSEHRLQGEGFTARLACAAVGRREVVSGWDLQAWAPKPAEAAVPAGSVYWFDRFEGDAGKLAHWVAQGLRPDTAPPTARHAEGWNQAQLGLWPS